MSASPASVSLATPYRGRSSSNERHLAAGAPSAAIARDSAYGALASLLVPGLLSLWGTEGGRRESKVAR
jgi:hypothetical protein